jgi:hypothetical protein
VLLVLHGAAADGQLVEVSTAISSGSATWSTANPDLLSGALDTHLSTVSNRLNVVMKQLAIIATVFLSMSFLTVSSARLRPDGQPSRWPGHLRRRRNRAQLLIGCTRHLVPPPRLAHARRHRPIGRVRRPFSPAVWPTLASAALDRTDGTHQLSSGCRGPRRGLPRAASSHRTSDPGLARSKRSLS